MDSNGPNDTSDRFVPLDELLRKYLPAELLAEIENSNPHLCSVSVRTSSGDQATLNLTGRTAKKALRVLLVVLLPALGWYWKAAEEEGRTTALPSRACEPTQHVEEQ